MDIQRLRNVSTRSRLVHAGLYPAIATRRLWLNRCRKAQQRLLDHLQTHLAEDPVVRVDAFEGVFAVDARSDLFKRLLLHGEYEPDLAAFCRAHPDPGRDAVDIGANVGFFTVLLAAALPGRRVLAIEPAAEALARLRANVQRNQLAERVTVCDHALAARAGETTLTTIDGRAEYASLGSIAHPAAGDGPRQATAVSTTTLDQLIAAHALDPGFIKMDVEGAEKAVLDGARHTLEHARPLIVSELNPALLENQGASANAVVQMLQSFDYEVFDFAKPDRPIRDTHQTDIVARPR